MLKLTCYCLECLSENYDQCENKSHVAPFKLVSFISGQCDQEESDVEAGENELQQDSTEPLDFTDVVTRDSIVAIQPSTDAIYSYFLLRVTSEGVYELENDTKSQYGHMYLAGSKVVEGHFLNYEKSTREGNLYKEDAQTIAIVPQECILYYGIDLTASKKHNNFWVLQNEDHEDILCTIAL